MKSGEIEVGVSIDATSDVDSEELQDLTLQLRDELCELDIEAVEFIKGPEAPERTKGIDPQLVGELLVTLVASGGIITTLINTLQSWINRHNQCNATIKIGEDVLNIKGISIEQQDKLIESWVSRHSKPGVDSG